MINTAEFAYFNRQLAGLLKSGIPLEKGIQELSEKSEGELQRLFSEMEQELKKGVAFEDIVKKREKELPSLYTDLCSIGVKSGNLSEVLETFASFAIREKGYREKLKLVRIYPVIVLVFSLITGIIITVVMPGSVSELLSGGDVAYSFSIKNIISDAVFIFINCCIAVLIIMLLAGFRMPFINREILIWKFPPAKYVKISVLSSMFNYLSSNGVPLSQIPGIVKNSINDSIIGAFLTDVDEDLKKGKGFTEALHDNAPSVIPATWLWIIQMSRESGALEKSFEYLENYYREKADVHIKLWIGAALPVLTAAAGIFIFVNICFMIHRFLPLFAEVVKTTL